ncbi:MAG: NAD(P)-dependent oxidoreductase [Nitrososphaerota archaeon]|nr:NAD(P)-dependent oxidoreductase [Nitrososphaerota archaeon]
MKKIGFVGLGNMGLPMASRLIQSGFQVVAFNRTRSKMEQLKGRAELTSSAREVAEKGDPTILMLTDTAAVEDVLFLAQGMYERLASGQTIINCSTILPSASKRIMERLKRKNVGYIEAPLFGGPLEAKQGELIAVAAGERERYEENLGIIKSFASKVFYTGHVSTALSMKLALNQLVAAYAQSMSEALVFTQKLGIDPSLFVQVLNSTGFKTTFSEGKGPNMIKDSFEPTFFLSHMMKDLNLTDQAAHDNSVYMPLLSQTRLSYLAAMNMDLGNKDFSAIAKMLKDLNK